MYCIGFPGVGFDELMCHSFHVLDLVFGGFGGFGGSAVFGWFGVI